MAVLTIRWSEPKDSNWTFSRVYRATSIAGIYSLLDSVAIGTYSYEDANGSSSNWYKVSFFDGVNESSLSDPVQGGSSANYCSISDFRSISPFGKDQITDADIVTLMSIASTMVHRKVTTKHKLERDLEGPINGSNTIFYTKWVPIADADMDSDIDISDVDVFYATWDANNRIVFGSAQTISSVDARSGRVTMSTSPTTSTAEAGIYLTYFTSVEDLDYESVKLAANYMLAHLVSLKLRGETANYNQVKDAFLRPGMTGMVSNIIDPWQHPYLKSCLEIIHDIVGKGSDGIGFSRVDAHRMPFPETSGAAHRHLGHTNRYHGVHDYGGY